MHFASGKKKDSMNTDNVSEKTTSAIVMIMIMVVVVKVMAVLEMMVVSLGVG